MPVLVKFVLPLTSTGPIAVAVIYAPFKTNTACFQATRARYQTLVTVAVHAQKDVLTHETSLVRVSTMVADAIYKTFTAPTLMVMPVVLSEVLLPAPAPG